MCSIIVQFYYFPHGYLVFTAPLVEGTIHSIYIYAYNEELYVFLHSQLHLWLIWFFVTPWTIAHQASLSLGFSSQENWSGLLFPTLGYFHNPRIQPVSPALAGRFFTSLPPVKDQLTMYVDFISWWSIVFCWSMCIFFNQDGVFWLLYLSNVFFKKEMWCLQLHSFSRLL